MLYDYISNDQNLEIPVLTNVKAVRELRKTTCNARRRQPRADTFRLRYQERKKNQQILNLNS